MDQRPDDDALRPAPNARRPDRNPSIHYAWFILAASVIIELFGLGFGIFAITTVYPYIIDTFPAWPRTTVFAPTTLIITTVAAMSPITGTIIDRYPIRMLFGTGIVVQAMALYLFSTVQTPTGYYAVSIMLGLGMSTVTILPNQVLVSRWFRHRVGLVNGILLAATALGAAIAPPLITRIIEVTGWRVAFQWMSLLALGPPLLVTLLLVRDRPADRGIEAYGTPPVETAASRGDNDYTLTQALRSPFFWVLVGAVFFGGMPCYSYSKHILVHLKEMGYAPVEAADYKGLFFLIAACSRVSFGWLCDHFDKRWMVRLHFLLIAGGYPLLLLVPEHRGLLLPCLAIVGVGYGGLLPTMPILSIHTFGRRHLGKILGIYKVGYDIAAAGAPLLTAWLYDLYQTYRVPDLWMSAFAWVGVALVFLGLPARPQAPARNRV